MNNEINYDFSTFVDVLTEMKKIEIATVSILNTIKIELNRFFQDSNCKEVIFTNNNDKMFFGLKTIPILDADNIYDYLIESDPIRLNKYIVEIDSKLLNPILDLSPKELMSIILNEVGNLVGDSRPMDDARNSLNTHLAANNEYIRFSKSIHYKEILAYGLKDFLSKSQSMFYTLDTSDIYNNQLARMYNFDTELIEAYKKVSNNNIKLYENSQISKFIVFSWTLSLYKDIKTRRIGAAATLTRAKLLTGSRLERMEMDNVINRIKRIDDDAILESSFMETSLKVKIKDKMRKSRLDNLRKIDNTFYELSMQVKNVEDEEDALYLMRQINNNISIIDGYINSGKCDEYEITKCNQTMTKFTELRTKLSETIVYKNKNYGLFVNYPEIIENRY